MTLLEDFGVGLACALCWLATIAHLAGAFI